MATALVTLTGSIYNASTGAKWTTGRLYLKPKTFIRHGQNVIVPATVSYDIPGTGNISLGLAPSTDSVTYTVEFDPNPADTSIPFRLKSGYFKDEWLVSPSYSSIIVNTSGLVGYWKLNETAGVTANDYSANSMNGTYAGGVTLNQAGVLADGDAAASFDGVDDVVSMGNNFGFPALAPFSFECWVFMTALSASTFVRIVSKENNDVNGRQGWDLVVNPVSTGGASQGRLGFETWLNNASFGVTTTSAVTLSAWNHIVCTMDGTTVRIYLNGALNTGSGAKSMLAHTAPFRLGAHSTSGGFFGGLIDEAAVYNRALSATEVTAHIANSRIPALNIAKI
jgi:hypothetical protein